MLRYLTHMLQLLLSPTRGWEDVAAQPTPARKALTHGLLPLIAVVALTAPVRAWWDDLGITVMLLSVLCTFVKYLLAYYVALLVMVSGLPYVTAHRRPANEDTVAIFLCLTMGMMVLIGLVANVLPVIPTLVHFLPLYVMVVMFQGRNYVGVANDNAFQFLVLSVCAVIAPVYLLAELTDKLLL